MDLARSHGIDPLIGWRLESGAADLLPADDLTAVRKLMRDNTVKHLALSGELLRILRLLRRRGITAVPLKGPMLASILCEDFVWRTTSDIDLLVRPADITRAKVVVAQEGYRLDSHLPWSQETVAIHWNSQLPFTREDGGVHLDLHWRMLPSAFPCAAWFDSIWNRLVPAVFETEAVSALNAEDLLLYLCAHGAKHSWQTLAHVVDIAKLQVVRVDLDWARLMRDSRRSGGELVLAMGLWLASQLAGARMPDVIADEVGIALPDKAFRSLLIERLLTGLPEEYESSSEFWIQVRLASGWRSKLRYTAGYALLPTEAEAERLNLPRSLFFLYYPYRQARLAVKYGARMLRP